MNEQVSDLQRKLSAKKEQVKDLQRQQSARNEDFTDLQRQVTVSNEQVPYQQRQLSASNGQTVDLQGLLSATKEQLTNLYRQVRRLREIFSTLDGTNFSENIPKMQRDWEINRNEIIVTGEVLGQGAWGTVFQGNSTAIM